MANEVDSLRVKVSERELELHDGHEQLRSEKVAWTEKENVLLCRLLKSPRSHLSPEHPNPTPFDGSDPKELNAFITDLKIKLRQNNDWWPDEQARMGYVMACLKGKARENVNAGIDTEGLIKFKSTDEIIDLLRSTFGDLDEKGTARKSLLRLKQGNRQLANFLPEWQALAGRSEFNEAALIVTLREALHGDTLNCLSFEKTGTVPTTPPAFISSIRSFDNTLRSVDKTYTHAPILSPVLTSAHKGGDPMDLSVGTIFRWTAKDVADKRRPRTFEEREARRAYNRLHNLCGYCSDPGHSTTLCPINPYLRSKQSGSVMTVEDKFPGNA